jgi:hypothetical protein
VTNSGTFVSVEHAIEQREVAQRVRDIEHERAGEPPPGAAEPHVEQYRCTEPRLER